MAIAESRDALVCDQAVFTSIRSPMGEGYRLVAASAGVCPEEKAELTRRSPSHGSLCDAGPGSTGLLSYRLGTGRHGVAFCCHAGREHTARGGERVYTHTVLLDEASYRRFDSNPVRVHAILADIVGAIGPMLQPVPRLEPLELPITDLRVRDESCVGPASSRSGMDSETGSEHVFIPTGFLEQAEWIWPVASRLAAGQRGLLNGVREPLRFLEWVLLALPRAVRESVDVSVGLRFSPGRQMHWVFTATEEGQQRLIAGQDIARWHADDAPAALIPAAAPWFELLRRWWHEHRLADMVWMTSHLCAEAPAAALTRLAALGEDLDRLRSANGDEVGAIAQRHVHAAAETSCEGALIEELRLAAQRACEQAASRVLQSAEHERQVSSDCPKPLVSA